MTSKLTERSRPVIAIANAGGHMTQALCALKKVPEFHFVTTVKIQADTGAKQVHYILGTQKNPLIFFLNFWVALYLIITLRPAAVFSTGGPACIPFAVAAKAMGVKFVYLDTLSRVVELSNTAKFLYKYGLYSKMMVQWEAVSSKYPNVGYYGKIFDICNTGNKPLSISKNDNFDV